MRFANPMYSSRLPNPARMSGGVVGRVLSGEKPGDLPVMRPSKFEPVINLRTAKALGIEVPNSLQLLADEVIE